MNTHKDCIPCFFKQAKEAAKIADATEVHQQQIVSKLTEMIDNFSYLECPPFMGRRLYQLVARVTGKKDIFKDIKYKSDEFAIKLYPELKKRIEDSDDKLLSAVMLAIIGNIIDYGAKHSFDIKKEIDKILNPNFDICHNYRKALFEFDKFKRALNKTDSVLYLADNAGEVVFDRILIEEMKKKVIYVVRERPIINDALREDATICGIDKVAEVISSGCDGPGLMLRYCNKVFLKLFNSAKMIISKGQGNFEALSREDRCPIFFLFRVKCDVVAEYLGFNVGDIILKANFCRQIL
jgi:hypothetical protein